MIDRCYTSAIDNATRGLINLNQLSVTCGLFFSLGHSTIVIAVNVGIAISSNVYHKIGGVGKVGAIVGDAVSGSFLFIIGLANTIILWRILKRRRQARIREQRRMNGEIVEELEHDPRENNMLMMRIIGPIITFVDRPWKMYPVGVLFGFGFDTASSIALLAVSALARKGADGSSIPGSQVVILPLLFTAGMTLVDSADSVLMLYSYSGFPERSFFVFEKRENSASGMMREEFRHGWEDSEGAITGDDDKQDKAEQSALDSASVQVEEVREAMGEDLKPAEITLEDLEKVQEGEEEKQAVKADEGMERDRRVKLNVMSGLSITLTLMSILVAFSISLIVLMGLIGDNCGSCIAAAEADDGHGGGLAGRWWRGWANANDQSGFIGVGIVGGFLFVVVGWYGGRWVIRKLKGTD